MTEPASPTSPPDTEQRIFDAALTVFASKGHDGARMQEIADLACINRALLHYYFRSKRQLYEAVFAHLFEQYVRSFQAVLPDEGSFRDILRTFVDNYIDYMREHQDMARLILNENLAGGTLLGEHLARAFRTRGSPQRRLEDAILRAIDTGEIRSVDAKQTILTIISSCVFFFLMAPTVKMMNPAANEDFDAFVEARKDHVFHILYEGVHAQGAA